MNYNKNIGVYIYQKRCIFSSSALSVKRRKSKIAISQKNFKSIPIQGTFEYKLRQMKDPYVKKCREEGYRCRSAYKLKEINEKHKIIKSGMNILDLGCAPGSWCQVLAEQVFPKSTYDNKVGKGTVVGVDLTRCSPVEGVTFIEGDFTDIPVQNEIIKCFKVDGKFKKLDLLVSDAAPRASGIKSHDAIKLSNMIFSAYKLAFKLLKQDGTFLFKMWMGPETNEWKQRLLKNFKTVQLVKPPSSRKDSSESFLLCKKFKK